MRPVLWDIVARSSGGSYTGRAGGVISCPTLEGVERADRLSNVVADEGEPGLYSTLDGGPRPRMLTHNLPSLTVFDRSHHNRNGYM